MKSKAAARPRTATPLGRGVYVYQATGQVAYLGSILSVIDSHNRDTRLGCHCPPEDVAEVAARLWDRLDALDPAPWLERGAR
jgi:hypothetical protein